MRMLEEGKISSRQLTIMTVLYILGSAVLIMPGPLATVAKRDAWIAAILAMVIGLLSIALIHALGRRFPGLTLMAYTELLFFRGCSCYLAFSFCLSCRMPSWKISCLSWKTEWGQSSGLLCHLLDFPSWKG